MKRDREYKSEKSGRSSKSHNTTHGHGFYGAHASAKGGYSSTTPFAGVAADSRLQRLPKNSQAVDIFQTTTGVNCTAGVFTILNAPQVGSAFYNRLGNDIVMKSIRLRAKIIPNGSATGRTLPSLARIMVVYDRQANGSYPSLADVLTDYNGAGSTQSDAYSGLNMNNRRRFLVLMDDQVVLPAVGASGATAASAVLGSAWANDKGDGDCQGVLNINRYIKLKGLPTIFKASSNPGVVGDISSGSLFLLCVGDDPAAAAATGFNLVWSARLKFTE